MENQILSAIIVDDEKPSREALSNYIREFCPEVAVVATCNSAKTAYKSIMENNPELVFLDIEMPKGNGFDLLRKFDNISFKVIFVTAFSEYAVQAFRFSATDYLMKPVKVGELIDAVKKVKKELNGKDYNPTIQTLLENLSLTPGEPGKLVIPDSKGFQVINTADIIYCEANSYCTIFQLTGKQSVCSSKNLKHYEELLPARQFMRVHHSFMVNLKHITGYTNQGEILLTDYLKCPLSGVYKQNFLSVFKKFK